MKRDHLKEALDTGNETERFCVYRCGEDGIIHSHTGLAKPAQELLETGKWFRSPVEAEAPFSQSAETTKEPESDPEPKCDKRSKEYREWRDRNQKTQG